MYDFEWLPRNRINHKQQRTKSIRFTTNSEKTSTRFVRDVRVK